MSGYHFDAAIQFYTVRRRGFHPLIGLWLQRDPIAAINTYQGLSSSPINFIDPQGSRDFFMAFHGAGGKDGEPLFSELLSPRYAGVGTTYTSNEKNKALMEFLKAIDTNNDKVITEEEIEGHTLSIIGYSWGGIAAAQLSEAISLAGNLNGTGYTLDCPIPVKMLITLDPVQLLRTPAKVKSNVESFVNFYQKGGPSAGRFNHVVFDPGNAKDLPVVTATNLSIPGFSVISGSTIPSTAVRTKQINVRTAYRSLTRWGVIPAYFGGKYANGNYMGSMQGYYVNHVTLPWYVAPDVVSLLRQGVFHSPFLEEDHPSYVDQADIWNAP